MSKLNKKSRDSIRPKYSVSPKIGIGGKKQAQKTIDSTNQAIKYNDTLMAIKRRIGKAGGVTTSNESLYNQNIQSRKRKARAQSILYGNKVGPKKPKLKPGN